MMSALPIASVVDSFGSRQTPNDPSRPFVRRTATHACEIAILNYKEIRQNNEM
jgi:hypothetical protein